jgi:transaldolase
MSRLADLKVKIFADGADYDGIVKMARNPLVKGFTTNPSLMRKAGVTDYEATGRCRSRSSPTTSPAWPSRRARLRRGDRT